MKLFLLRHAEAFPGKDDALRELTPKGIESLQKLSDGLIKKELMDISEIRHSPLVRARQTAEHFKKMAELKAPIRQVPLLEPYDDFRILADMLNTATDNLLLVGHQPNLGMLASYILTLNSQLDLFKLKKGALLCLERFSAPEQGDAWEAVWQVRWLLTPRIVKRK